MKDVLNPSAGVLSYAKLDRWHQLKITYRDETGIPRNYEVDFIVKTAKKNYLVETKADRDLNSPNVAVKAKAAVAWCQQATTVLSPSEYRQYRKGRPWDRKSEFTVAEPKALYKQSRDWEYLIISESLFKNNRALGFGAFIPLCQGLRDRIIAQAENKLFLL